MRLRYLLLTFIIFTVAILGSAQAPGRVAGSSEKKSDFLGSIKDGRYTNRYFGFELDLPPDWSPMNSEEIEAAKEIGTEGLKTENERINKLVDDASTREVVLLGLGKKPLGSLENSAFAIGIAKQPSAKVTPKMVAEALKSLLLKNPANKLVKDISVENIGGRQFAGFELTLGMYGVTVPLKYYATMVGQYSLTISLSYADAESLRIMEASLKTIKFTAH